MIKIASSMQRRLLSPLFPGCGKKPHFLRCPHREMMARVSRIVVRVVRDLPGNYF